ncbi:MAG TPA: zf-TFIIB domain-containing protein [Pyrinomonadaceae bacterium]|nr:zf-TFIIB domain-containing protein [Pyrinomonadaceae bacterium]
MLDGERCIRCGESFKFEQLEVSPEGLGICHSCPVKISGADEPKRFCPVDGREMDKAFIRNAALVDRCLACRGVWFDGNELEMAEQEMRADGFYNFMFFSLISM